MNQYYFSYEGLDRSGRSICKGNATVAVEQRLCPNDIPKIRESFLQSMRSENRDVVSVWIVSFSKFT